MATITYDNRRFTLVGEECVLDTLLRAKVEVPHACRSGVCRACTMVAESGPVPDRAQQGLREVERRQGLFLACQCWPEADLEIRDLDGGNAISARVVEREHLSDTVVRVRLQPAEPLTYEAGQYVAVQRADGLTRSYSLASLPSEALLELHVRKVPGGRMSTWFYDEVEPGTELSLRRAHGSCCYPHDEARDTPMLLVGVGTGLAPLWGVVRQALASGHTGAITLIQAAASPDALYMRDELDALARAHPQLSLRACVLHGEGPGLEQGDVTPLAVELVEASPAPAAAFLAFVCGDPAVVQKLRRELFLAGVASRRILADAFITTPPASYRL